MSDALIIPKRFVGLHCHSGGSILDAIGTPQEHIDFVIENGMNAWALTDHGNMNFYAHAWIYSQELKKKGVDFKFIPGIEFYITPDLDEWRRLKAAKSDNHVGDEESDTAGVIEDENESKNSKHFDPIKRRHHLVVLAKSQRGLKNLFRLVTRSYHRDNFYKFPRIDYKMLKEFSEDLVVSSACVAGPYAYLTMKVLKETPFDQLNANSLTDTQKMLIQRELQNELDQISDAVGVENTFAEIQFNSLPAQHVVNRCLFDLSKQTGVQLIATADSHYPRPGLWQDRELYKKLGRLNYQDFKQGDLPQSIDELKCELYPKNAEQMWSSYKKYCSEYSFYDDQIVCDAIEKTYDVAHSLIGDIKQDTSLKLPSYVVPAGKTPIKALADLVKEGLIKRGVATKQEYIDRAKYELDMIREKGLEKYFLTVKKVIDIATLNMLVGCGRGSSAGSLVNYALGITQLDPIKYGLLFERFISRSRHDTADVDSDFSDRDQLVTLLKRELGKENVFPISNHNTFQLRSLVKDVAKFYGIPFEEANEATKTLDDDVRRKVLGPGDDKNLFQLKYDDAYKHSDRFRNFIDKNPEVGEHIKVLFKQSKTIGKHAGGIVIGENLDEVLPLIAVRGDMQVPFPEGMHIKTLEATTGIPKIDILGLTTLRIMERAIELIIDKNKLEQSNVQIELENGKTLTLKTSDNVMTQRGLIKASELCDSDDVLELAV